MSKFKKRAGANFDSWEHRIDHQLLTLQDRVNIEKTQLRKAFSDIGELQARHTNLKAEVHAVTRKAERAILAAVSGWLMFLVMAVVWVVTR